MAKRKNNQGRVVAERWVFGMYDVHQKIGVLRFVDDRTQATLFPIIAQYVLPGTTIHSDRFSVYVNNNAGLDPPPSHIVNIAVDPPYQHLSVNHKVHFVDPVTGACTNTVEGFWKNAKQKNKAMSGTTAEMLPSYLDEFQWRQVFGKKTTEAFNNILAQIAHFYPVND
jgi:transposase-like protein